MSSLKEEIVEEVHQRSMVLGALPEIRMISISSGYSFVELENDRMGLCFTPHSSNQPDNHYDQTGRLKKKKILELTKLTLSEHPLEKSIGIAAVAVLSQMIMDKEPEKYNFAKEDFLTLIPDGSKIGMVGYMGSYVPYLLNRFPSLTIVDNNPDLYPGIQENGSKITRKIADLADSDILIISGSCGAVGDFEQIINAVKRPKFTGIVGPSAGWLPEPAFRRGVDVVAGTKIIDNVATRNVILEGGGTPNFKKYGKKYAIVRTISNH